MTIAWQGGEPTLMGLDFHRSMVALVEGYRRPGMEFLHTMQTNGTLLDDARCEFFKEYNFLIGISFDGLRELHVIYPMQALAPEQIQSFREFPPRQKPAAFNLDSVLAKMEDTSGGGLH